MKQKMRIILLVLLLGVWLTGCGSNTPAAPTETEPSSAVEESSAPSEFIFSVSAEGNGSIAYVEQGGGQLVFSEEYPTTSARINVTGSGTYLLGAKPGKGAAFVRWTKDGKAFSEEEQITVSVSEAAEFVAVFKNQ